MPSIAIIPSTVGYHWEELFAPYQILSAANWSINFYTVDGKAAVPDPNSIKPSPLFSYLGAGTRASFAPESERGKALLKHLDARENVTQLSVDQHQAIYLPGGHGVLFDVNVNAEVQQKLLQFYQQKKPIGAVCHATSSLAFVKVNGVSIVKDRRMIGFLDALDSVAIKLGMVDKKFLPLPYWNEQTMVAAGVKLTPVDKILGFLNPTYTVVDLPFITGVGPKAAANVGREIVKAVAYSV